MAPIRFSMAFIAPRGGGVAGEGESDDESENFLRRRLARVTAQTWLSHRHDVQKILHVARVDVQRGAHRLVQRKLGQHTSDVEHQLRVAREWAKDRAKCRSGVGGLKLRLARFVNTQVAHCPRNLDEQLHVMLLKPPHTAAAGTFATARPLRVGRGDDGNEPPARTQRIAKHRDDA